MILQRVCLPPCVASSCNFPGRLSVALLGEADDASSKTASLISVSRGDVAVSASASAKSHALDSRGGPFDGRADVRPWRSSRSWPKSPSFLFTSNLQSSGFEMDHISLNFNVCHLFSKNYQGNFMANGFL